VRRPLSTIPRVRRRRPARLLASAAVGLVTGLVTAWVGVSCGEDQYPKRISDYEVALGADGTSSGGVR
jgi:hypothetical protein